VNHKKRLSKGNLQIAEGDCSNRVHSDQIVLRVVRQEAGSHKRSQKVLKTKLTHGESSGLGPLKSEGSAGPYERQLKTLKGKLEDNSRKPRDLTQNRHSESLKKGLACSFSG
jgi:hypothetical protein